MTTEHTYRKKPVEVQVLRFDGENFNEIADFVMGPEHRYLDTSVSGQMAGDVHLLVHTLEGEMRADVGDFIIRGVKGEYYPCKPDIFEMTYDKVEVESEPEPESEKPMHAFIGYDANPGICRICGGVQVMPGVITCHRVKGVDA